MKVTVLSAMLLMCFAFAAAQSTQKPFHLQGTVDKAAGKIYLFYTGAANRQVVDSAVINKNKFSFNGMINGPVMATIAQSRNAGMQDPNVGSFYIDPGTIHITLKEGDYKNAVVTGSQTQDEYHELQSQQNALRARFQNIFDTLNAVNKRSNVEFQVMKNWVLVPYEKEQHTILSTFLHKHPQSMVAPMALMSLSSGMSADTLAMYYNRFPENVKNSGYGKVIGEELNRRKIGVPGTKAADFTKTDINGKTLTLSDFRGKYVLLDFWASWCVPCRAGNPHLLKQYAAYKDKGLEIIGVSDDDGNPKAWKAAVEKDGIGVWRHVLRGFDMDKRMSNKKNPDDISESYGIATLPTKILVDPNGMIIGRYGENGQGDKEMDEKLAEVFK